MSTNANAMIRAGVNAYQSGDKAKARQLLEKAIELDQYSEMAWLWLSAVVESKEEQQTCLTNVLVINPENARARQGLKSLGVDPDSVLQAEEEPEPEDEYYVPTSSASSSAAVDTPEEAYDDWMDNLGIGEAEATTSQADVFGADDFSSDAGFDFGEDLFSEDTYDTGYDTTNEDDYAEEYEAEYYEDAYETEDDLFNSEPYGDEIDEFDDLYADRSTLDEFNSALDEDIHDYDMDEFTGDPFAIPEPEPEEPEGPTIEELFAKIPAGIVPTRLPGMDEETPTSAYIPMAILGIMNVLAVVFIILQLL